MILQMFLEHFIQMGQFTSKWFYEQFTLVYLWGKRFSKKVFVNKVSAFLGNLFE